MTEADIGPSLDRPLPGIGASCYHHASELRGRLWGDAAKRAANELKRNVAKRALQTQRPVAIPRLPAGEQMSRGSPANWMKRVSSRLQLPRCSESSAHRQPM